MVICLERGAHLHMSQLMPLPLTVSCFSKIQIGFTFLVPAYSGSPGQRAVKRARACMRVCVCVISYLCFCEWHFVFIFLFTKVCLAPYIHAMIRRAFSNTLER